MNRLLILIFTLLSLEVFAQGKQTPEKIIKEVKTGKAYILKDNNAGGYYGEERDSAGILSFEYHYIGAQNDQVADDELSEIVYFNIKPDKTGKFLLSGNDLKQAQAHFYRGCFCMNRGTHLIESGTIRGVKMSKTTWYINANVMVKMQNGDSHEMVNKKIKGYFNIITQP